MHDIKYIRNHPQDFCAKLNKRGIDVNVNEILALDSERREIVRVLDRMREHRNTVSKDIGRLKKEGNDITAMREEMVQVGESIKNKEAEIRSIDQQIGDMLLLLPNLPADDTPAGVGEEDNETIRYWGDKPHFDFNLRDHLELGERLGILDFRRGGKVTGSGFPVWSGAGAALERALLNFMLDIQTHEHGYREMMTPFIANRESMQGSGQIPKLEDDMYRIDKDDIFLLPTSEVTLVNLHRDEIIAESDLPINYAAYSPCFRREAGAYGHSTRGFLRTHQFNKIELVSFINPDKSYEMLEVLTAHAEEVLRRLDLHYKVVRLCAGELSFAAAMCYDLEVWAPADGGRWLEVSSCSNCEAFQARRANIRYRPESGGKLEYLHTLNGSGLATSRLFVALLEAFQTEEGSIAVPPVLRPYMNGMTVITSAKEAN